MAQAPWPAWVVRDRRPDGRAWFTPILELWGGRFGELLARAGLDSSTLRNGDGTPRVTNLGLEAVLRFDRRVERVAWAPNVVAVLPGSDPVLRHEYLVLTAHLDGLGRVKAAPPTAENVLNGADDNASGVAVLAEVARALAAAPVRPKRSVIFAAVSGEELGFWGSDWFTARPPIPARTIVANLNLDMVGRARGDSVFVTGLHDAPIGPIAVEALGGAQLVILGEAALEAAYPGQRADDRSDHASFRRLGVPAISFSTGYHPDYHETTDDAALLNYDGLARLTRAVTRMATAIANAPSLR